jgi:hypothetical protein
VLGVLSCKRLIARNATAALKRWNARGEANSATGCGRVGAKGRPQEETQGERVRLTQEELTLLLGGIDLERTRAKNWYRYEEKNLEKTSN